MKKTGEDDEDDDFEGVRIEMNQAVTLTFSLKYLVNFSKSSSLSKKVQLMMSNDVPLLVSVSYPASHRDCAEEGWIERYRMVSTRATSGTTLHPKLAMTRRVLCRAARSAILLAISLLSHLSLVTCSRVA